MADFPPLIPWTIIMSLSILFLPFYHFTFFFFFFLPFFMKSSFKFFPVFQFGQTPLFLYPNLRVCSKKINLIRIEDTTTGWGGNVQNIYHYVPLLSIDNAQHVILDSLLYSLTITGGYSIKNNLSEDWKSWTRMSQTNRQHNLSNIWSESINQLINRYRLWSDRSPAATWPSRAGPRAQPTHEGTEQISSGNCHVSIWPPRGAKKNSLGERESRGGGRTIVSESQSWICWS